MSPKLGFGVTAHQPRQRGQWTTFGNRLAELGYDQLWSNDDGRHSGLATLALLAGQDCPIALGLGAAPLDTRTPAHLASEIAKLAIQTNKLVLGVGSGRSRSLNLVRTGVAELRVLLPGVNIAVAAIGPRMCELAGEVADTALLNWSFPEWIVRSRRIVAEAARSAGRREPSVAGYVRVAIGLDARNWLRSEAGRYAHRSAPYSMLLAEQEASQGSAPGVAAVKYNEVATLLQPYREVLDTCIVRPVAAGIPATAESWLILAESVAR